MDPDAEARLAALALRVDLVDKSVESLDRRCADIEGALMTNTALTHDVRTEITGISAQMRPVLDAVATMESGIRMLGRIGRFGERFGRAILFLVALGVVIKFVLGGASWSDLLAAFSRAAGR